MSPHMKKRDECHLPDSMQNPRMPGKDKWLLFAYGFSISYIVLQLSAPSQPRCLYGLVMLVMTISYLILRKKRTVFSFLIPIFSGYLTAFWFFRAYYRITHSTVIVGNCYVYDRYPASESVATLYALPYMAIALIFLVDIVLLEVKVKKEKTYPSDAEKCRGFDRYRALLAITSFSCSVPAHCLPRLCGVETRHDESLTTQVSFP